MGANRLKAVCLVSRQIQGGRLTAHCLSLWPEYVQLSDTLRVYLDQVTERVVSQLLQADSSEAEEPRQLELGAGRTKG